jgi:hypothetical protein
MNKTCAFTFVANDNVFRPEFKRLLNEQSRIALGS